MKKLWQKNTTNLAQVEKFTIGEDTKFDLLLAPYDVLGSMAHARMLEKVGLLSAEELKTLQQGLSEIYQQIAQNAFVIEEGVEDVHSQVEMQLTQLYGEVGKKLHSGRSRNDQVLVDLKLYYRKAIQEILEKTEALFKLLIQLAETHKNDLMPGYTHTQLAMPSSFGLWFSASAESLTEDLDLLYAAFQLANKNPLGSAAGYGSSFPLDRSYTTELLGFGDMHHNVMNAQNSRGKTEKHLAFALSALAATLNKLSADACLFMNQHFAFISFPDELTTGSSIMPHKKNPDVWELIRAKSNQLQSVPYQISLLLSNLSSGYHRDLQLLKEAVFPAIENMKDCLDMTHLMLEHIQVKQDILKAPFYQYVFSVEAVNALVLEGVPFRDAYQSVGQQIEAGEFKVKQEVEHTHEGSIGNLCLEAIEEKMEAKLKLFDFAFIEERLEQLKAGG